MSDPLAPPLPADPEPGTVTPDPSRDTAASLSSPVWERPVTWWAVGATVSALVAIAVAWASDIPLPQKITATGGALTGWSGAMAAIYARKSAFDAAAAVSDRSDVKIEEVRRER